MGSGSPVSSGALAVGLCRRCGLKFGYKALMIEVDTSLFVCEMCLDQPDPRRTIRPRVDALTLKNASPDADLCDPIEYMVDEDDEQLSPGNDDQMVAGDDGCDDE